MATKKEPDYISLCEAIEELHEMYNENVPLRWIMHPLAWFAFKLSIPYQEYQRYLEAYVWSAFRKRFFPWLSPWEKIQALIMRDDLMQLFSDYEYVEIEWKKKEQEDVQE